MTESNIDEEVFHKSNTNIDIQEARVLQSLIETEGFEVFCEKFLPFYQQKMLKRLYKAGDHETSERLRGRMDAAQELLHYLKKMVESKLKPDDEDD